MNSTAYIALLSLVLVGCDRTNSQPGTSSQKTRVQPSKTVEDYIARWSDMGMWLPDAEQVNVFCDNFDSARGSLREALSHNNQSVRMRAAYVIGEIGDSAKPAGEELLARLTAEPDELVRIYIIDALIAIGYDTDTTITVLVERYEALDGSNVPPNEDHYYAEVDEKITVASALYSFVDIDSKTGYLDFVIKWLDPPDDDLSPELLDGYWIRRWIAVHALEQMSTATEAIPRLESLKAEPNAKPWVHVHVPRILGVLRKNSRQQDGEPAATRPPIQCMHESRAIR